MNLAPTTRRSRSRAPNRLEGPVDAKACEKRGAQQAQMEDKGSRKMPFVSPDGFIASASRFIILKCIKVRQLLLGQSLEMWYRPVGPVSPRRNTEPMLKIYSTIHETPRL
ncbi:hypothetical protein EVAR_85820_1 [Eumeta japonica]|uniref:Uncharacterized protein n=1 Tax=Eumeta variegata TaxID=151549 RepID=A0A4C1UQB5_EUMVA|nr:hypothetical protein EVAR_85820_1 [Eumeta japonica]